MAAPVTHVLTVHWQTPRWIEPQMRGVRRHLPAAVVWASLDGIDGAWDGQVDHALRLEGTHAEKLNELARRACAVASPTDRLLFLDGDAFPIAPVDPDALLDGVTLAAVRRDENLGDPQPHPCFCLTTVGAWTDLEGDWREGPTWTNEAGEEVTDVGAELLRSLTDTGAPWRALRRTNRRDLDPLLFAVYGDVVYHHGAGFRSEPTRLHWIPRRRRRRRARALVARTPGRWTKAVVSRASQASLTAVERIDDARRHRREEKLGRWIDTDDDLRARLLTTPRWWAAGHRASPWPSIVVSARPPSGAADLFGAGPDAPGDEPAAGLA